MMYDYLFPLILEYLKYRSAGLIKIAHFSMRKGKLLY